MIFQIIKNLNISFFFGWTLLIVRIYILIQSIIFFTERKTLFIEWEILISRSLNFIILFLVDWISLRFMSVVTLISRVVIFYSFSYLKGDKNFYKFIILVFIFVTSIILIIMSPNLIRILIGWDGLGLVSYCLVIYYNNVKSSNAGILTILSNRIGDIAILLAISWSLNFGSWSIISIQELFKRNQNLIVISLVIIAAITKSAQIPFSAWLPAAIAAPTPVSSLVHSSTLVTAGVYLLIRFNLPPSLIIIIFIISVLTIFMSGLGANYEIDLKKIIALSTLSQLGVIIIALSVKLIEISYFHLLRHALFKSLLFLCAGFFIHSINNNQDIRRISGAWIKSPVITLFFLGASMSLCGFPFLSGFYSKDIILEFILIKNINIISFLVIMIATALTLLYRIRLILISFLKNINSNKTLSILDDKEIFIPITILFSITIIGGAFLRWSFFPKRFISLSFWGKIVILLILLFSTLLNKFIMRRVENKKLNHIISRMWNLPFLSTFFFSYSLIWGSKLVKFFDQGWSEAVRGQGTLKKIKNIAYRLDLTNPLPIKSILIWLLFIMIIWIILF